MSMVSAAFTYEIGQMVYLRAAVEHYKERYKPLIDKNKTVRDYVAMGDLSLASVIPAKMMIVGRVVDECHAGAQTHYRIRMFSDDHLSNTAVSFHEYELTDTLD